jgi:hypothetical protein
MGDVDDVEIYAAEPIYQWQQTEHGQWVMENATDLTFHTVPDPSSFGHKIIITGNLADGPLVTEYLLKYSDVKL